MFKKIAALATAAVLCAGLMAGCGASSTTADTSYSAENPLVLTLAHGLSEAHTVHIAMTQFAEEVNEKTDGRVQVKIFPNGQLGSENENLEQLQAGVIAMTKVSAPGLATYNEAYNAFGLPYIFNDTEDFYHVMDSQQMQDFFLSTGDDGFVTLTYYTSGARSFYTKDKAIRTPADLKGLKIRVQDMKSQTDMMNYLGGIPVAMSYINPMDINLNYADDDNPLGMKSDFILSLCELIMGARDGMEPEEKSVIDRCLPLVYQKYLNDPKPENMPTLGDLYDCLREQKERQAQRIATALEIYVNGSLRVFNHQTNVELDNRIICFDIKELGKQLKKLGMLIVQDQVWNRVTINRNSKKNTRYYIDEFHLLLKEEQTAAYSVEIWKRFRKWGGVPTGITQNIKDLLASREIENIFENSDFIYMLNQASGDRQILAKQLNISPFQLSYVTNSNEGEGLLFYGNTIIPFKDKFDTSLKLYSLMTTKPNEMGKYKEKKEA